MTERQLPAPAVFDEHSLVEYVEAVMLVEGINHLSMAELTSRFRAGDKPQETELASIRPEIRRRSTMMPRSYPYTADAEGVARTSGSGSTAYDFLIVSSLERAPYRLSAQFNRTNKMFDLLVREAIKHKLGPGSEGVRFGTPVQDGRPQNFIEAVTWLAEKMRVAEGLRDRPADANDAGVDVVAWHHFVDARAGFPVVLAQSTLELNYVHKALEIPIDGWKKWLDVGHPTLALAIPFTVPPNDDRWLKVGYSAMLYDRVRICSELDDVDISDEPEWMEMQEFISTQCRLVLEVEDDEEPVAQVPLRRKQKLSEYRDARRR